MIAGARRALAADVQSRHTVCDHSAQRRKNGKSWARICRQRPREPEVSGRRIGEDGANRTVVPPGVVL